MGIDGALVPSTMRHAPFPPQLAASGKSPWPESLCFEVDPAALRAAVENVLHPWLTNERSLRLGFACQRSSFLLFDRRSNAPLTPVVSWRDRRAEAWCAANPMPDLPAATGLRLGPHYALPKLAAILEQRRDLATAVARGEACFGSLETWLMHCWSKGAVFATDPTMAARTLGVATGGDQFDPSLLARFGVPPVAMPNIVGEPLRWICKFGDTPIEMECAGIADQQAGAWSALGGRSNPEQGALLNFGTGTFVLLPTGTSPRNVQDCLTGPLWPGVLQSDAPARATQYLVEGTVHAGASILSATSQGKRWCETATRDLYCLPDVEGTGAPHWTAHRGPTWLPAKPADPELASQIEMEGLVFRAANLLTSMETALGDDPREVFVAGGVATRETVLCRALAATLDRPVMHLDHPEAGLLGAAARFLAAPPARPMSVTIEPDPELSWLQEKHAAWRATIDEFLQQPISSI